MNSVVTSTSANISSESPAKNAEEVKNLFGEEVSILDGKLGGRRQTNSNSKFNNWRMDKKLKLAVIGNPISHSKSPEIHQNFADQFKVNIEFNKYKVTQDNLEEWLRSFFKDDGRGVSITLPLKEAALNCADEISERARLASALSLIHISEPTRPY